MMNFDLDSVEGMENAKQWTMAMIALLKDGGTWVVPRSLSIYRVYPTSMVVVKLAGMPDPSITRVFLAMGWKVQEDPPYTH